MKAKKFEVSDDDVNFEEIIINNPERIKPWFNYIESKKRRFKRVTEIFYLYERALLQFPGSYKLWYNYLIIRMNSVKSRKINLPCWEDVNECFERSLYTMYRMPIIWKEYLNFLILQKFITRVRKTFDRCLKSLPVTQHPQMWEVIINWIRSNDYVPFSTCKSLYYRYLKLYPFKTYPDYVVFLNEKEEYGELCNLLQNLLFQEEESVEESGHSSSLSLSSSSLQSVPFDPVEIWKILCRLIREHPREICSSGFNVDRVLRYGLQNKNLRTSAEFVEGEIWGTLANYSIFSHDFEKSRDIFEEGLSKVVQIRDFTYLFDAYSKFEETITQQQVEKMEQKNQQQQQQEEESLLSEEEKLNFCLRRWESLLDRRPFLLNNVRIRQNPHSVYEWLKRIRLYITKAQEQEEKDNEEDDEEEKQRKQKRNSEEIINLFTTALEKIDPLNCSGSISDLWIAFSQYYEEEFKDLDRSRRLFELAIQQPFHRLSELTKLYAEYAEMELRNGNFQNAKQVLHKALFSTLPSRTREKIRQSSSSSSSSNKSRKRVQQKIYRSIRLWSFLIDLNESMGEFDECEECIEVLMDLKLITPTVLLNYTQFLYSQEEFDHCWGIYERGLSLFSSPQVLFVYSNYLIHLLVYATNEWTESSLTAQMVERIRELFDRCFKEIRTQHALNQSLFLLCVKFEERYGRVKRAMELMDQMMGRTFFTDEERGQNFEIYVQSASQYYSVSRIREIFQKGLEILPQTVLKNCVLKKFIDLEMKLGEVDRARALYANGAKICSDVDESYFNEWEDFENRFGNLETFKELFKIKDERLNI